MDNLAIQTDSNVLTQYSRSLADKTYADHHETLLGHLICERGKDVKSALEDLRPIVKTTHKQTLCARDWCMKFGFGGLGVGVLVGAGMGIGFAIPPIIAGTLSLKFWADSRNEVPRREAEYHLLKTVGDLPEALYALHLRGVDAVKLVGAYDALVVAIEGRLEDGRDFTEAEVGEFLRVKIESRTGLEPENQADAVVMHQNNSPTGLMYGNPAAQTEIQNHSGDANKMVTAAAPSMSMVNGVETIAPRDIATDLGNNPQSALIFGTPGAGKGMNISNAIRTMRAKYPKVTVMMIDPKGNPAERGYWENQVDIFESKPILKVHPRSAAEWMLDCADQFRRLDGPKLLIWDELYATVTVLKSQNVATGKEPFPCLTDFQVFISTHLSLGPSEGIWVWGMSQSANLSDLGLTSGGLSTTRIIALVSPDNTGAIEGLYATKAITAPKGGMETIERLMEASPVGRACYDGKTKRWYPMARLENHSGFDRDNADWNNLGKVAPETRSPSIEERKAEIERMKANIADMQERAIESEHERMSSGIDYKMHDSFNPPRDRLERLWNSPAIEVETQAIDDTPDGLEDFPLVLTIWEYLNGKDARSMKQISGAMKTGGKISDETLTAKLGQFETYKDAIKTVVSFGVSKGFLRQVSEDSYEAIRKH
jgi:hypothetical protein